MTSNPEIPDRLLAAIKTIEPMLEGLGIVMLVTDPANNHYYYQSTIGRDHSMHVMKHFIDYNTAIVHDPHNTKQ